MKRVRVLFIRTRNIKGVRKSYQVNRYILIEMKMEWYKQRRLHTELATIIDGNVQMLKRQNKKVRNITTLPLKDCAASENTKKFAEFLEFKTSEGFGEGEGIGYHFVCRAVRQRDMI